MSGLHLFRFSLLAIMSMAGNLFPLHAATGEWSEPVRGMRGRLVVEPTHIGRDRNHRPKIYLELEQSYDGNPMLKFDYETEKSLHLELRDKDENAAPHSGLHGMISGVVFSGFQVKLPTGGRLRFLISSNLNRAKPSFGLVVETVRQIWTIPDSDRNPYFLSGTLKIPKILPNSPNWEEKRSHWAGELILPPVLVPASPLLGDPEPEITEGPPPIKLPPGLFRSGDSR